MPIMRQLRRSVSVIGLLDAYRDRNIAVADYDEQRCRLVCPNSWPVIHE
jgi:hypothetical protein